MLAMIQRTFGMSTEDGTPFNKPTFPQPGGPYNKIDAGIERIPFSTVSAIIDGKPSGRISSSIRNLTEAWPIISLNLISSD